MENAPAKWLEVEEDILRKWYERNGSDFCDTVFGELLGWKRGARNVMQKAWKLGLRYKGPRRGVFKKGLVPFNKGRKMPADIYEQCAPTMFKKGHKSHNTKPEGEDISIRYDNRGVAVLHKKIGLGKWVYLSRYNYEKYIGKIPKGYIVTHKDGNTMNCDPSNLQLMTRADNARRNYSRDKFMAWHRELTDEYVLWYQTRYKHAEGIDLDTARANGLIEIWRAEIQLKRKVLTVKKVNNNEQRNKKASKRRHEKAVGVHG